ncbi:MAG TPA: type III secretion system export apparatus subunit SctS [Dyella sp.]|uniref:type III secretion system export apparatus subunit SctS n=1 Tax=Dyella sp. TaxID=1869338 RepID=UPI002F936DF9
MDELMNTGSRTLFTILMLAAGPVFTATIVGLSMGLIQTVTQVQEQTLSFGVKLISVTTVLVLLMGWLGSKVVEFADFMMQQALL